MDPTSLIGKITLGIIRHFVGQFGAGLVTQGLLTNTEATQGVGAVMVLISLGFSAYDKWQAHSKLQAAQTPNPTAQPNVSPPY